MFRDQRISMISMISMRSAAENSSDRSTYPDEKSVLRSGATPELVQVGVRETNGSEPFEDASLTIKCRQNQGRNVLLG
jgi:hypothetical protein